MARPIFRQQPRINISELRMQYISASYPAEITSSTGQLSYKYLRQLPLIESSDGVFTNDFVGGRLVVESPQNITPSTGSGVIASGYSTRYQGTITSVINNSLAVVSPPYYFKLLKESNGYSNPISYYFSPSKFDSSDYTITYRKNESGSQVTNDIYQSFVNVELADLIPESGRVSAVRLFARSQGFKTFEHLSDEPLLPVELFVNLTSSTNEYVPIGKIKDTNHVNFYWTSEIVNGTQFTTTQTYDKTVLTDALKVEITAQQNTTFPIGRENFYAKFYTNNPIKVYKNNDYIVTFKLANRGKDDWEHSSGEVRGPRLLFAISGSAIRNEDGQLGKVYDEIKSDSVNTTTPSIVNGNGLIYQNQFDYNAGGDDNIVPTPLNGSQSFAISDNQLLVNSPIVNDIRAYIFRPERDGYINPVFAVNTGIWYISDISIKPYVLDGRTPTHTRVKAKTPTYKQNDSLDIKLEFLNEQGEVANISFITSSLLFSGSSIAVSSGGGTSGPDGDWYDGGTYITTSKAVHITASFESSGSFTANVTDESFKIIGLQNAIQGSYSSLIIDNAGQVWKTGSVAGGGGVDNDWYDSAAGYITTSNDVHITGSLYVSGSQENTGSLYISGSIENVHYIDFDTNQSEDLTYKNGRLFYNTNEGALTFYNEESDIGLQIGQEFYVRVFNDSDNVIQNGTPVYVSGAQGDKPKVWPAAAEPHYEHNPTENHILGLATHDIEAKSAGYVTELGIVRNIAVGTKWAAGDTIYVSSSGGELTNIRPEYPYEKIEVGILVRNYPPGNGFIFVKPESPTHFENISELSASTPYINGQVFVYDESAQGWTNTNELTNITASSIIASGSFSGSFVGDGSGLTGISSGDNDWFDGGTYLTTSKEVQITSSHLKLSDGSIYGDTAAKPILRVQNDQFTFVSNVDNDAGVKFSTLGGPNFEFTDLDGNSLVRFFLNEKEHLFSGSISASGELIAGLQEESRGYFVAYDPNINDRLVYQSTSSIITNNASIISGSFTEVSNSIVSTISSVSASIILTIDSVSGSFATTIENLELGDNDWFDTGTYLTTSKDVQISGSIYITGSNGIVVSGSAEALLSLKQLTSGQNVRIVLTNGNDKTIALKNTTDNSFSIDSANNDNAFKIASNASTNTLGISASGVIIGADIDYAVNNRFIVNKQATIISGAFIQTASDDVYFQNLENQSTEYYVSYNQSDGKITYTDTSSIISNNASIISGAFTEVSNSIVNTISSVSTSIISTINTVSGSFATTIENLQLGDNDWFDTGTYLTTSITRGVQITASADVNEPALFLYRPNDKDVGFQIGNSVATYKLRADKDEFVIDGDAFNVLRIYKNSTNNRVVISGSGVTIGENSVDADTFTVNQDKLIFKSATSTELQLTGSLRQTGSPIITFEHLPEGAPKTIGFVLYDYSGANTPKYRLYYTGSDAIPELLGLQNLNYWRLENSQLTSSFSIVLSGSNPAGQIFVESLHQTTIDAPDTDGYPVVYYETSSGQLVRQSAGGTARILSAERVTATYPSSVGTTRRITNKNIEIVNGYFAITGSGGVKTISDVEITGSLNVTGSVNLNSPIIVSSSNNTMGFDVEDIFIIKNSNDTLLKIKNSGLLVLKSFETEPTAEEGAIYYNSSSFEFFVGVGE